MHLHDVQRKVQLIHADTCSPTYLTEYPTYQRWLPALGQPSYSCASCRRLGLPHLLAVECPESRDRGGLVVLGGKFNEKPTISMT